MGRRPFSDKVDLAYNLIKNNPGIYKSVLMMTMGYKDGKGGDALLPILERRGYLISEDGFGRLYVWNILESELGDKAYR